MNKIKQNSSIDKLVISFSIKYAVLITGLATTCILAIYFFYNLDRSLDVAVKIIGLGIGVTTAIYAALNLHRIHDVQIRNLALKKREFSFKLIDEFNSPEMSKLTLICHTIESELREKQHTSEQIMVILNGDENKRRAVISVLNFYEKMALTIKYDLSDEIVLKEFFLGLTTRTYNAFEEYIRLKGNRDEKPKVFSEFIELVKKWIKSD